MLLPFDLKNSKLILFFIVFLLPLLCFCEENYFSVSVLTQQVIAENDPVQKRDLLIQGINIYNSQITKNIVFFDRTVYDFYMFQYYNLVPLKQTVVDVLSVEAPNLDLSVVPDIKKPGLPFWMSFGTCFSGWFCFFILSLWIFF